MTYNIQPLIEQIQSLPPERIVEVEDFVAFISARENDRSVARVATAASEHSFAVIWDNMDDAAYDDL